TGIDVCSNRAATSYACGRVATGGNELVRFRGRIDHRTNHTVSTRIQDFHDDTRIQPWNPDERHCPSCRDGLEHSYRSFVVDQSMLEVDGQRVPSLMGHHLSRKSCRQTQPAIDCVSILLP